jgi:hypothetical protein
MLSEREFILELKKLAKVLCSNKFNKKQQILEFLDLGYPNRNASDTYKKDGILLPFFYSVIKGTVGIYSDIEYVEKDSLYQLVSIYEYLRRNIHKVKTKVKLFESDREVIENGFLFRIESLVFKCLKSTIYQIDYKQYFNIVNKLYGISKYTDDISLRHNLSNIINSEVIVRYLKGSNNYGKVYKELYHDIINRLNCDDIEHIMNHLNKYRWGYYFEDVYELLLEQKKSFNVRFMYFERRYMSTTEGAISRCKLLGKGDQYFRIRKKSEVIFKGYNNYKDYLILKGYGHIFN